MWTLTLAGSVDRPQKSSPIAEVAGKAASSEILAEWETIRRAQALDEAALGELYTAYYPRIYNYAFLQLGDIQAAEDLASDVMLKMLESLHSYHFKGLPFAAWVFRIARNRLIDLHRRRRRRGEIDLNETYASTLASPQSLAERAIERGQMQVALKHLTDEQRQVIVLKFIQGFDNRAVGRIMGRSEGAIKSLQHRALASLRRVLQGEER